MTIMYTPNQLGAALNKIVERHKKDLGKDEPKISKIDWIKDEAFKTVQSLEVARTKFNTENKPIKVTPKELISVLNNAINLLMKALESDKKAK